MDREPPKTIPYSAARTYIAHIGEYPLPPRPGHVLSKCRDMILRNIVSVFTSHVIKLKIVTIK